MAVPEEWLEELDERFTKENVSPRQRAAKAMGEWSKHLRMPIRLDSEDCTQIWEWFEEKYPGSQRFPSL